MEMKSKVLDKKHLIIIIIAIFAIIISYFNITYAFFSTSENKNISVKSAASFGERTVIDPNVSLEGSLIYKATDDKQNVLKNQTLSYTKDNVDEYDYELTIATQVDPHITEYEGNEYTSISYEIYHKTDTSIDTTNFVCENNKYNNGTSEDTCNTGTFIENSLEGLPFELLKDFKITDTNTHYFDVYIYLNNEIESKMFKTKIFYLEKAQKKPKTLEQVKTFISNNEPDLNTGLIPVVYDAKNKTENGTGWFVADITKAWYDYESQWWANAVSVDSSTTEKRQKYVNTDGTYKTGTEISTADMLAMFVWIPRYSYTIGCTSSTSCYGYKVDKASNLAEETPGAIDIKFVAKNVTEDKLTNEGIYPTYSYINESDRNPTNYYTHPAFTFGDDELTGIWVGKFETSVNPNSTCYDNLINKNSSASTNCQASKEDVTPRILPNVLSLVRQNVYNEFETAKKFASNTMYGLTNKTDSHMMKNSEWGAVVYLSQSIYGKYGNSNYTEKNKEIYKNDSGEQPQQNTYWSRYTGRSQGGAPATSSYSDEGTYKYDDISTTDGTKVANSGTGASTTGNIYGIYDMSGGAYEYVMGYYTEASSVFGGYTSGNYSGFSDKPEPDAKYFNGYKGTIENDVKSIDLFTKAPEVIGHATVETKNWYLDNALSISASGPWVLRGGRFTYSSDAGVMGSSRLNGNEFNNFHSFRSVLATIER